MTDLASPPAPWVDPVPVSIVPTVRGWRRWIGPAISVAIVVAVIFQLHRLDIARIWQMVPERSSFWVIFAAYYLSGPASEWIIFRRLWALPASGFLALLRKLVGNEILLGYIGEIYFYGWARRHSDVVTAPFGAVKDVAILSAITGNVVTLVMLAISWPLLGALHLGIHGHQLVFSIGVVVLTSLFIMVFRRKLFSLSVPALWFVANMHLLRIAVTTVLAGVMWHEVLPGVALHWWVLLATMRLLVSRLPFVPNKDLVFAGVAVFLIGRDAQVADLMTMMASVILATHLVVGGLLGAIEMLGLEDRR